jgi:hypothetical protein
MLTRLLFIKAFSYDHMNLSFNNPFADKQVLRIAEIPGVGVFVVKRVISSAIPADLMLTKVVDLPDYGFKTEVLDGTGGQRYLRVTDHLTKAYDRVFRVYGLVF